MALMTDKYEFIPFSKLSDAKYDNVNFVPMYDFSKAMKGGQAVQKREKDNDHNDHNDHDKKGDDKEEEEDESGGLGGLGSLVGKLPAFAVGK